MLYDKNLSVNRNEACAFLHMPETGLTGPVSELNRTMGRLPGGSCGRVQLTANRNRTPTRRCRPCCITIPGRATSSAATLGHARDGTPGSAIRPRAGARSATIVEMGPDSP